jgi:succinate dehydrogenase/fumarate reductase cytochrome b subunit
MSESNPDPAATDSLAAATDAADASQLHTLGVLYYVLGGLNVLMLSLTLLLVGAVVVLAAREPGSASAPAAATAAASGDSTTMASIFLLIYLAAILFSAVCAVLQFMAARRLRERRSLRFCQVVAGLSCLSVPIGTLLGAFTFVVLARPSLRARFAAHD